jgi:hypothetical protein
MQNETMPAEGISSAKQEAESALRDAACCASSFASLETAIACHSRDWAAHRRDAWIYGIVCGWDDASLVELEQKFLWGSDETERLKELHDGFKAARAISVRHNVELRDAGEGVESK